MDLRDAIYCLNIMKKEGHFDAKEYKIGRVKESLNKGIYVTNEIILYKTIKDGTLTIEKPLNKEELKRERERGSKISTICTMLGVPPKFIEEIILE